MMTIRRLIYREVLAAVVFVAIGFLALFFFFDFVDELPRTPVGKLSRHELRMQQSPPQANIKKDVA